MSTVDGRSPRARLIGMVAYFGCALVAAGLIGLMIADRRGPVLGLVAFLVYLPLVSIPVSWSFADRRRWSAEHVVLDALRLIPISFLVLLLTPGLPWWGAALISLVAGMVLVPLVVRWRTARLLRSSDVPATTSDHHGT